MKHVKKFEELNEGKKSHNKIGNELDVDEPITVKEMINFLKKCDQNAKIYYTLGGSCNNGPVTYMLEDYDALQINYDEDDEEGGILIGERTW